MNRRTDFATASAAALLPLAGMAFAQATAPEGAASQDDADLMARNALMIAG